MKTNETNQRTLSGKKLVVYVACIATFCILNSLDIQARDYKYLLKAKYGYDAIDYEEHTPVFPGISNYAEDFNYKFSPSEFKSWNRPTTIQREENYVPPVKVRQAQKISGANNQQSQSRASKANAER